MARAAAQKRRKRTKAEARKRRERAQAPTHTRVAEDTMFFPRLRRQAKWVFVFLALVFAIGFVIFGVGSGGGIGLGDLFSSGGGKSGQPSASEARKEIAANPKNAKAYRDLATALTTEGDVQGATVALVKYVRLRPKDAAALSELGGLYANRATHLQQALTSAQSESQAFTDASEFGGGFPVPQGQTPPQDPITQAVSTQVSSTVNDLTTKTQDAFTKAEGAYATLAQLRPEPQNVLQLGQIAQQAGDVNTAIASYQRFIKLAPDDPTVPLVKQQLRALKSFLKSQAGGQALQPSAG
jgi:tetratricopeptide (TPR) repeat protein